MEADERPRANALEQSCSRWRASTGYFLSSRRIALIALSQNFAPYQLPPRKRPETSSQQLTQALRLPCFDWSLLSRTCPGLGRRCANVSPWRDLSGCVAFGPRNRGRLDLPPSRRPPPRPVAAGQVLGHHALLSLGHQSCEEGFPRTNHSLREEQYRLVQALYQFLQSSTPFPHTCSRVAVSLAQMRPISSPSSYGLIGNPFLVNKHSGVGIRSE